MGRYCISFENLSNSIWFFDVSAPIVLCRMIGLALDIDVHKE